MRDTKTGVVANWFHRCLTGFLVSLLLLIFMGAIVRATGAGLGCPDWPRCWGALIPPWKVEQVNLEKLDWDKFKKKAERLGRDPEDVTPETILQSFNPVHTWTEFINRLLSLPVGLFSLGAVIFSFLLPRSRDRGRLRMLAVAGLIIVLVNAWMGREVVYSGLKPGIITTHLALAMGLIALLAYGRWVSGGRPGEPAPSSGSRPLLLGAVLLLVLVIGEGIMGAQVREMTDELAKTHTGEARSEWIAEIEEAPIFLVHRSFSWVILVVAIGTFLLARRQGVASWRSYSIMGVVLALMVMGIILAHVAIFPVVQVLHVGAAAILLTLVCEWTLRLIPGVSLSTESLAPPGEQG